jgi:hypothetical protein
VNEFRQSEYQALRATIRERGTARVWAVLAGLGIWGLLAIAVRLAGLRGATALVPFVVLAATFELNFFVHTGVERIGRYIQVFYEETSGAAGWETTAMNFGARFPGASDPLFVNIFFVSTAVNLLSVIAIPEWRSGWIAVTLIAHLAFAYRIVTARQLAAAQRALDLDRFHALISK